MGSIRIEPSVLVVYATLRSHKKYELGAAWNREIFRKPQSGHDALGIVMF